VNEEAACLDVIGHYKHYLNLKVNIFKVIIKQFFSSATSASEGNIFLLCSVWQWEVDFRDQ
jgi:hypothetical protein